MNDYLKSFMICEDIPSDLKSNEYGAFTEKHDVSKISSIGFSWDENSVIKQYYKSYGRQVIYNDSRDDRPDGLGVDVFGTGIKSEKPEVIVAVDSQVFNDNLFSMNFNEKDLSGKQAISLINRFPITSRIFSPKMFKKMKSYDWGPLRRFNVGIPIVTMSSRYPAFLQRIDDRIRNGKSITDEEARLFQIIDYTPIPDLEYILLNAKAVINGVVSFLGFNDVDQMTLKPIINHGYEAGGTQKRLHMQIGFGLNDMGHDTKYEHILKSFHNKSCDLCVPKHESLEFWRNDDFRALAAKEPKASYEVWIVPVDHIESFRQLSRKQIGSLAEALKVVNSCLTEAKITLHRYHGIMTLYPGYEPTEFHFHVRVQPKQLVGSNEQISYVSVVKSPKKSAVDLKNAYDAIETRGLDLHDYKY